MNSPVKLESEGRDFSHGSVVFVPDGIQLRNLHDKEDRDGEKATERQSDREQDEPSPRKDMVL